METIAKLIHDIFSMSFDVVVPISINIIAIILGFIFFSIRYFTFNHNRKKYEKLQRSADLAEDTENEKVKDQGPAKTEKTEAAEDSIAVDSVEEDSIEEAHDNDEAQRGN